jgi:preprotein translocase subunit SecF
MEFFKRKTNIDFLGIRRWTALFSCVLVLLSVISMLTRGINWGLDFTGGYQIQVVYQGETPVLNEIRAELAQAGIPHAEVVTFGSVQNVMIRLAPTSGDKPVQAVNTSQLASTSGDKTVQAVNTSQSADMNVHETLKSRVESALGPHATIQSLSYTGPSVGASLAQKGLLAMLVAVLATMLYIALRFEMRFAVSAAVALAHDPIVIMGIFSFFQISFNLTALAAVLAIIGYSLNDTVVIYDRIRENFRKMRKASVIEVVNRAVNDTLSRTVMTSGLTLLVIWRTEYPSLCLGVDYWGDCRNVLVDLCRWCAGCETRPESSSVYP